ncbi:MAG: Coenzyme F420 hydrogenase/dehydrogenase, beta subunit C-terminal domain [Nitrososphaerota archaeon]|nr:Coenzyme F420 hydrogenase/dehydrogenase, beta subunit C-terminal domain [Nitrososphaerales archaeon]MDW8044509.1 Coenzyme F420 hydrogenase/dehydrogenase, beta subunit C-terminal domain [Nitrososphaerota archaeon]
MSLKLALERKDFKDLLAEVVERGLCIGCGSCAAACPLAVISIEDEIPVQKVKCFDDTVCECCYYQCPKSAQPIEELESKTFGRKRNIDEHLGVTLAMHSAKTRLGEVMNVGQDGGIVSSLLIYALEEGVVDCAVVTGVSSKEPWRPIPKLAFTKDDILRTAGTKYTSSPTLLGLASALEEYGMSKVAFVGTPCQILAVRKAQFHPSASYKLGEITKLAIGLFCMESFSYRDLILGYIKSEKGIDPGRISKFQIKKGRFFAIADGKKVIDVPISEMKQYAKNGCHVCGDLTAELADISVGSIGSPEGWSTVIIRNEKGRSIFEAAASKGLIEYKPVSEAGVKLLVKISEEKRKQSESKV